MTPAERQARAAARHTQALERAGQAGRDQAAADGPLPQHIQDRCSVLLYGARRTA